LRRLLQDRIANTTSLPIGRKSLKVSNPLKKQRTSRQAKRK
jgi:hypothetical protein